MVFDKEMMVAAFRAALEEIEVQYKGSHAPCMGVAGGGPGFGFLFLHTKRPPCCEEHTPRAFLGRFLLDVIGQVQANTGKHQRVHTFDVQDRVDELLRKPEPGVN